MGKKAECLNFGSPLLLPQLYLLSDSCSKVNFKEKFNGKHSLFFIWICLFLFQEIHFIKQFIIYNECVLILYYYCMCLVHVVGEGIYMPWWMCGSQRVILWRWRSPSTLLGFQSSASGCQICVASALIHGAILPVLQCMCFCVVGIKAHLLLYTNLPLCNHPVFW